MTTPSSHTLGLSFDLLAYYGPDKARLGLLTTPHGVIPTPAFLFCATKATLKGLSITDIKAQETPILLANTYHLMLQPGADIVQQLGGLHTFMGWDKPLFTDSGGYQIFSLGHGSVSREIKGNRGLLQGTPNLRRITEEGAFFKSYIDGSHHSLTPESAMDIQRKLGADLICVLDECTPFHVSSRYTYHSMLRSHRWAQRCLTAFHHHDTGRQGLYGIIQGGVYPEFRQESAEYISRHPFFGHAIGGSLGSTTEQMQEVVSMTLGFLPRTRPIHLLGIGGLKDILYGVEHGIDTFDCVSPTRLGRHGGALISADYWQDTWEEPHQRPSINLHKMCFKKDPRPIESQCGCSTCQTYSRAYLHHLLKAKELLALTALTLHNVFAMNRFMADIRKALSHGPDLSSVKSQWNLS